MGTPQVPLADLIAELSDPNISVRRAAINKIMRRRKERGQAFQDFARLLNDADTPVRKAAMKALGKLGDPRALPYLARLLNDRAWGMRILSVQTLEMLGGAQVMPSLTAALGDRVAGVRLAALDALVRLYGAQALPYLETALTDRDDSVRLRALEHFYNLQGAQAIPYLLAAMSEQFDQMRTLAVQHLISIGQTHAQVVPDLLALATHSNGKIRVAVFTILARLSDPRSFSTLLQALHDEESSVRLSAVFTLSKLGDAQAVKPLLELCNDPAAQVRLGVAEALGKFKDPQAVEPLLALLYDPDTSVCAHAAWALDSLNDPRAISALAARFSSADDLRLRGTAMKALRSLVTQSPAEIARPEILEQFLRAFGDSYAYIREDALKSLSLPACKSLLLKPLLGVLANRNATLQIHVAALKVLEMSGYEADPQALETLLALIEQEGEYIPVRTKAIGLLAKVKAERAVGPLLTLLASADISLREAASEALGLLDDPRALEPLRALLAQTASGHLSVLLKEAITRISLG